MKGIPFWSFEDAHNLFNVFFAVSIYGIWFYDKEECQRIAELMKNLTQYEQLKAHQGTGAGISPMILNSGEGKEVDILRMLTKAKDEYTKCKACSEPKQITSSSAIYDNPNLIKPIPVKPSENQQQCIPRPSQTFDLEPQHLSLTALFGKQDKATCQEVVEHPQTLHRHHHHHHHHHHHQQQQQDKFPVRQGVVRSLSYEEPRRHSPPIEKQLCPAIQKLMVRGADLHPLSELPETRPCKNGNTHSVGELFTGPGQPGSPHGIGTSPHVQSTFRTQNLLEKLPGAPGATNKYHPRTPAPGSPAAPNLSRTLSAATPAAPGKELAQPPLVYFNGTLPPPILEHQLRGKEQPMLPRQTLPVSGHQTSGSGVISPQELLKKLQLVQQEQQLHTSNRPALAAKFPVVTQTSTTGKSLESWLDKTSSTETQAPLFQVVSPQHIPASGAPSLLMSPMVFTHPASAPPKERETGLLPLGSQEPAAASTSLLLPLQSPEPAMTAGSSLTKLQLQEALLYLIRNDDNFLNIIYEAYLFSMTQAAMKKTR
ncbi:mRNA-decapping enzyme 1B [Galemys pyrenaicus]|uniref:5'-(N(7)-methylguanosine 5'-triphospho)-[mRNA] hydrolase n=1 Tax=Galemys pyrenaicus TaxID=202257 RepID=A0A8J6ACX7_GALPY|nr:mRNA-decapping enzyme 1B [Galemys pyrenaicus]